MMLDNRILVALSGGIDSAATVIILRKMGYEVAAVTFNIFGDSVSVDSTRALASRLGVELFVEDISTEFSGNVIKYFVDGYMAGITPAPCSLCNPFIKWATLMRVADREGFGRFATGHYVRIVSWGDRFYVAKGVDASKDQSYYLSGLGQDVLARAVTPLGDYTKGQIREMMTAAGFSDLAAKRESMGVCFLRGEWYGDFLRERVGDALDSLNDGDVVDTLGVVVGRHRGFPFYTVGQRRGFSLDVLGDYYVVGIDALANRLVVGDLGMLYCGRFLVSDYFFVDFDEFFGCACLEVKVRGLGLNPLGFCRVSVIGDLLEVFTEGDAYAVALGQPVVFYIGDRVVGGGTVDRKNDYGREHE